MRRGVGADPTTRRLAWGLCLLTLATVAGAIGLAIVNHEAIQDIDEANAIEIVLPIGFAILGGLAASRQPGNALGWLFLAISFCNGLPGLTSQYTRFALVTEGGAPFSPWIPWVGYLMASLVYPAGLALAAILRIPTGHLLSARWLWVQWAGVAVTALLVLMTMLDPAAIFFPGVGGQQNPTGVPAMEAINQGPLGAAAFLTGIGILVIGGWSLVFRLRRATGEERLQMRLIVYAAVFSILANLAATIYALFFLQERTAGLVVTFVTILGFGVALPLSFGIAILRYRLYDLDLFLNRTIVYGAVTGVLLVAIGVADVLAQRAMVAWFNQRSDLLPLALGLAAGLAFRPMRRAVQPTVDRILPARARLTLLFTDIVESTQAIVDLGDERWRELLGRYRAAVRHELARHRGREVNTAGDAFFAVFDRPANGVECAVAMRDGVKELGLSVRTGLHCGEVEMRGEQVTGLAVHAAARVMAEAGADQVILSRDLADELEGELPLRDVGTHALRGVPGEWQLFEVTGAALPAGTAS
jgi:class 3 adenylate cyclase